MGNVQSSFNYRWFGEVWNKSCEEAIEELLGEEAVTHGIGVGNDIRGIEGFKAFANDFKSQFSDIHVSIEDVVREQDVESCRCTVTAKHRDSGKSVRFTGMTMIRIRDGKIVEGWNNFDFLTMYQQLGKSLV